MEFVTNTTFYFIGFNVYAMKTATTAGSSYSKGDGAMWDFPSVKTCPQVIINSSNYFYKIIGLSSGTYPGTSDGENHAYLSDITPETDPTSSIIMTCSFATQKFF